MLLKKQLIILFCLFISCNNLNSNKDKLVAKFDVLKKEENKSIYIQPFEGFPQSNTNIIEKKLKQIYSGSIIVNNAIPLPKNAKKQNRNRYCADTLIRYLGTLIKKDDLIIGLTKNDISTTKDKNSDWGIFGLGYKPGKSCVVSTFKLKGNNKLEKLFKLVIHELGHNQGLALTKNDHCTEKTCFMRAANGRDHLDELKMFCPKCKSVLIKAGWKL